MRKIGILIILLASISIWSCDKNDTPEPTGTEGELSGSVKLFDEGTQELSSDSMIVSIYGSNPLISDTTDVNGKYSFSKLKYGTYTLSFTKANYGIYLLNNVYHKQEHTNVQQSPSLGQRSSTHISAISSKDTLGSIFIFITTDPAGTSSNPKYFRVFFHTNDMVSYSDFTAFSKVLTAKKNPIEYRLNPHALEDMGFVSGQEVWYKVYGESYYSNAHIEPLKGKHIFPNLNLISAAANSFIVP